MDELEYYSLDEIEDMELPGWEIHCQSDFELLDELATIVALKDYEMVPRLDHDQQAVLAEAVQRKLLIRQMGDDWECLVCGALNSFDCDWCRECGLTRNCIGEGR